MLQIIKLIAQAAISVCALANVAFANADAIQACATTYANATTDFTRNDVKDVEISYYYGLYCEENGQVKSDKTSAGLGFELYGVPISAEYGNLATSEQMQRFCKENTSYASANLSTKFAERVVVIPALQSFNSCIDIAKEDVGLAFSHQATHSTLTITGSFLSNLSAGTLDSLTVAGDAATCKTSNFGTPNQELDGSMEIVLSQKNFTITCTRDPVEATQDGTKKYPSSTVTVGTSWGQYVATMPAETLQGFELATQAALNHGRLLVEMGKTQDQLLVAEEEALKWKTLYDTTNVYSVRVSRHQNDADFHIPCDQRYRFNNNAKMRRDMGRQWCLEKGQQHTGMTHFHFYKDPGSSCWTDYYALRCTGSR